MNEAKKQEYTGLMSRESAYILFSAKTYRVGTTQTAEITVTVRKTDDPNQKLSVEVWRCRFTEPVRGEEVSGRRTDQVDLSQSWQIDSDSDDAMKDFTVTAFVSSESIGDIESTVTFKYKEM
jgi:hypothetical protein